jgi:hypothetical protein
MKVTFFIVKKIKNINKIEYNVKVKGKYGDGVNEGIFEIIGDV